jgi:RHS repeat-associated protein
MTDFPAHLFDLRGSPEAIAASAQQYQRFGQSAAQASERIAAMDTGQFLGPEGDRFRQKLASDLPPHLRVTGTAFTHVGQALMTFSSRLADLQAKMRPLEQQAPGLWQQVKAAEGRLHQAQSADQAHARAAQDQAAHAPAGQTPPPAAPHTSDTGGASASLSAAHQAWQECVDRATALRTEMIAAAQECARQIDDAKGMRFQDPPGSWDLIGQGRDFIREHKDDLKSVSDALKYVSAACAAIGLVLQAIPVVGNAVGGAFLAAGTITGVAALGIDAGIYAATGEGNLTSILIDGALTVIPGGKIAKLGGRVLGSAGKLAEAAKLGKVAKGAAAGVGRVGRQLGEKAKSLVPLGSKEKPACLEPIDVDSGRMFLAQTDVELDGVLPLVVGRIHVSSHRHGLFFGPSWVSTLDQRLEVDEDGVYFSSEDGLAVPYPHPEPGAPVLPLAGPRWPLERGDDGSYAITDPVRGRTLRFARFDAFWLLVSITDRNGHRIDVDHDDTGLPTEISHSGGYRIRVETKDRLITGLHLRNGDGAEDVALMRYGYRGERLTQVINESGHPLLFDYDGKGQITGWTDRNGVQYRYTYDAQGRCVRTEGSDGFLNGSLSYDTDNGITHVTDSFGHRTAYHLDRNGQVVREVDPLGAETVSEWDFDLLLSRTDPLGRTTTYSYGEVGNLSAVRRPDGTRTRVAHNELRQPTTVTAPDGTVTRREHDERGNLLRAVDPAGSATSYEYDEHGHLVSVTDALGNVRRVDTNAAGLPVAITDPLGATTRYERDAFGRVVAITDPVGGVTRFGWTVDGKPTWRTLPDGATERWLYDAEGNLQTHVDALGQRTRTEITHFDLPSAEVRPDGTRLEFGYDTELRLVSVTNEQGLVWRYDYDAVGNLVRETDFNDRTLTYRHDRVGQLVERTNGAGESTAFARDLMGRVAERRSGESVATFSYDDAGRLREAVNQDARVTFDRDVLGRVLAETINDRTLTATYDALGRRTRRVTPSGAVSDWSYDANDNPTALRTAGRALRFDHDAAGREIQRSLGDGAVLTQEWDPNHQLTSQVLNGRRGRTQRRAYSYRADGFLTRIEDQLTGGRVLDLDQVGRVTAVRGAGWTERYAYDAAGNITTAAWPAPAESADADALGEREYSGTLIQRAGKVRYEHDAQGRMVLRQHKRLGEKPATWRYSWDADGRMAGVVTPDGTRWRYLHDPLGRRTAKQRLGADGEVVERVDFTWDGVVLAEQAHEVGEGGSGVTVWDYEPGTFRPLTQRERFPLRDAPQQWVDEQFHAIVTDLVGSPAELVDDEGGVAWSHRTMLWGQPLDEGGTAVSTPLRFPGQYADPETGLNYNFHRHYDPEAGRYASADPLGLAAGPNPHRYVHNPWDLIDPLGLMACSLYHYTNAKGQEGILNSGELRPSTKANNPNDARYGDGQYLTDIEPGSMSNAKLSRAFIGQPFQGRRFTHYVEIDARGLDVRQGRDHVFVVPGDQPLDVSDRIISWG